MVLRKIALVVAVVMGANVAWAQESDEARRVILQRANRGDWVTVTLRDGARMRGRLVDTKDGLTLRHDKDQRTFTFNEIGAVTRTRNGLILGPVIGTAAGLAIGIPVRTRLNNEGENGNTALTVLVVSGVAAGTLLDALIGSERTIYRRTTSGTAFGIAPTTRGVTARWRKTW